MDVETAYTAHYQFIRNVCWRLLGNRWDAEDVAHEVFTKARFDRFDEKRASLKTWLYAVAVNQCKRWRRTMSKQAGTLRPAEHLTPQMLDRIAIDDAVKALPEGCRNAFILHSVYGFQFSDVGRITGTSEAAAKVQCSRARKRLSQTLA